LRRFLLLLLLVGCGGGSGTPTGDPDAAALSHPGPDGGVPDAGAPDAGHADAGPDDGGVTDAGVPDAGSYVEWTLTGSLSGAVVGDINLNIETHLWDYILVKRGFTQVVLAVTPFWQAKGDFIFWYEGGEAYGSLGTTPSGGGNSPCVAALDAGTATLPEDGGPPHGAISGTFYCTTGTYRWALTF
jgi:hypothetical protein